MASAALASSECVPPLYRTPNALGHSLAAIVNYDCSRLEKRFLEEERAKSEQYFRQEYLCEFVEREKGRRFRISS